MEGTMLAERIEQRPLLDLAWEPLHRIVTVFEDRR